MSMGGGSSPSSNTVTQVQNIPTWMQEQIRSNQDIANSLASTPYPVYGGQMIASPTEAMLRGQQTALDSANAYAPFLEHATSLGDAASGQAMNATSTQAGALDTLGQTQDFARTGGQQYYGIGGQPQTAGDVANQASMAYIPYLQQASGMANQAAGAPNLMNAVATGSVLNSLGAGQGVYQQAAQSAGKGAVGWGEASQAMQDQYMNPYVRQGLAPQIAALQEALAQQQRATGQHATQSGAFGDARQGVEESLNNVNSNNTLMALLGQGYGKAYDTGVSAYNQGQQLALQGGSTLGQLAQTGQSLALNPAQAAAQLGQTQQSEAANTAALYNQLGTSATGNLVNASGAMNAADATKLSALNSAQAQSAQMQDQYIKAANAIAAQSQNQASLGTQAQQLGANAASQIYNVGTQQQNTQQANLNNAYQQFINQANWPFQMQNVRLAAVSNQPYSISNSTTLPPTNSTAQNIGAFSSLAGALGSMFGGSGGGKSGGSSMVGGA